MLSIWVKNYLNPDDMQVRNPQKIQNWSDSKLHDTQTWINPNQGLKPESIYK